MGDERPASSAHLFDADASRDHALRAGLLAALAIHLVAFVTTWPTFAKADLAERPRIIAFRLQPFTFVKPPPLEPRVTAPPRRIPIPDPDPQGPEPVTLVEPEPVPINVSDVAIPFFPEAPPTSEESGAPTVAIAGIDVAPPSALHRVEPRYTETARRIRFEGAVILSLLIDTDGRVVEVTVLRSLPFGLTESAVEAARQWQFEPCKIDHRPVTVRMTLTVHFRIAS